MTGLSLSSPCSLPSLTPPSPERPLTTSALARLCLAQTSLPASLATLFLPASSVTISPSKSSSRPPSRETS